MHDSNRSMPTTEAAVKTKLPELITKAEALKHALHAALTFQAEAAWKRIDANQKAKLTKTSESIRAKLTPCLAEDLAAHDGELAHKLARLGALGARAAELPEALAAGAAA